jgi:hypothetical protein
MEPILSGRDRALLCLTVQAAPSGMLYNSFAAFLPFATVNDTHVNGNHLNLSN